jgi:hypothetical protein
MPTINVPCRVGLDKSGARRRLHNERTFMNNRTTYSLLLRSEEKSRDMLEMTVYALCVLSAVFAIWQFAQQPISVPTQLGTTQQVIAAAERCSA